MNSEGVLSPDRRVAECSRLFIAKELWYFLGESTRIIVLSPENKVNFFSEDKRKRNNEVKVPWPQNRRKVPDTQSKYLDNIFGSFLFSFVSGISILPPINSNLNIG